MSGRTKTAAPSSWAIQRAMAAWMEARQGLLAFNPQLADDESAVAELMRTETADVDAIMAALIRASIEAEMMASAVRQRREELAGRQNRWEKLRDSTRVTATAIHEILGWPTIREPDFTASKGTSAGGVRITNADIVPDEFCKIERIPRKIEIGVALDAGREVAGAEKSNSSVYLRITKR